MAGRKLVFDLEANGFLRGNKLRDPVSKVWMIVARDVSTEEEFIYCDYYNVTNDSSMPLNAFRELFDEASELIGHNVIQYDLPVLKKILHWEPQPETVIRDTLLMSQLLDYNRFGGVHNLETWGAYLGVEKPKHEDWDNYSDDMVHRCREDVVINTKMYKILCKELSDMLKVVEHPSYLKGSLRVEHKLAEFQAQIADNGWRFDVSAAEALERRMENELADIRAKIEPDMPYRLKVMDKDGAFKVPEFTKSGNYKVASINHFKNIGSPCEISDPETAHTTRILDGPYVRVKYLDPDLGSIEHVKHYLYKLGWEPLDWNWERVNGELRKKSPKLCEESLTALGEKGVLINRFYTTRSRLGILQGWLAHVEDTDTLRGDMFTIATPTGRSRHKIVVNVPSPNAAWGKEMRALFGAPKGYKVVGADSSGNQFRALCHYINDDEFTDTVINGDIHQENADILGCDRPTAKPWIYAFLFGAGYEKLGLILTGKRDSKAGKESKKKFAKAIPGFKTLSETLDTIVYASEAKDRRASIPALDGRRVYLDSAHKALNYLLQSAEGITCKAAVAYAMDKFKEEGIPAFPLIFYHDEMQWAVKEGYEERAAEICKEAFREAPKWYGVTCMDGEAKIGDNWFETH